MSRTTETTETETTETTVATATVADSKTILYSWKNARVSLSSIKVLESHLLPNIKRCVRYIQTNEKFVLAPLQQIKLSLSMTIQAPQPNYFLHVTSSDWDNNSSDAYIINKRLYSDGIIDCDYTGELFLLLSNKSMDETIVCNKNDVISKIVCYEYDENIGVEENFIRGSEMAAGFDLRLSFGDLYFKRGVPYSLDLCSLVNIDLDKFKLDEENDFHYVISLRSSIKSKGVTLLSSQKLVDIFSKPMTIICNQDLLLNDGERIFQLILCRKDCENFPVREIESFLSTKRGANGFGSTGKF